MVVYPIGSVSIFINVNDKQNQILDEVLLNKIAKEFERYLSDKLKIKIENIEFDVRINWRRGCLIEIASLGIIITGAYKFIKDYDKIRENILLIFKDLKGAILMIKGKESKKSRERKITEEEIRIIDKLSKIPEEDRKYIESQYDIMKIESDVVSTHRITILREDLSEVVYKKKAKELTKEVSEND